MAKEKTCYVCASCGYETLRWLGCCPECGEWNTFEERKNTQTVTSKTAEKAAKYQTAQKSEIVTLDQIEEKQEPRSTTGNEELDRVLGGGLVPGSAILIGGDPGIGKSTLLLQVAGALSERCCVLYASGEESTRQLKMRASRIKIRQDKLYVLAENDVESILTRCERLKPDVLVIDSIQTMVSQDSASAPGSVSQVRQSAGAIVRFAKETGTAVFIVGHVTKEGSLAGPRILEHMVDAVLYFEGDRQHEYRLLRAVKNRFGSVNELGVFEMRTEGMIPVPNPSESLLSQRARGASGSVVFCTLQGSRPILCDLQALASRSFYSVPKRTVGGMDSGRIALLLAVMEKRAGKKLFDQDVYINVAGGLALSDPAADLAVCIAVASSLAGFTLSGKLSVMGEVGLCGEVRPVAQAERRVAECVRLGFTEILLPKQNLKNIRPIDGVQMTGVDTLMQALAVVSN
ncbi:MAG: DNA repair protein RadA [Clostridiales bacterium]|nr:DNA repair protein RadA [Clostridiales bacterium]